MNTVNKMMSKFKRDHPIIVCPPPLPFGWGEGEPPTPEYEIEHPDIIQEPESNNNSSVQPRDSKQPN